MARIFLFQETQQLCMTIAEKNISEYLLCGIYIILDEQMKNGYLYCNGNFIYLFIYWCTRYPVDPMGMGVHKWCQKQELHVLEILEWFDMNKKYFIVAC